MTNQEAIRTGIIVTTYPDMKSGVVHLVSANKKYYLVPASRGSGSPKKPDQPAEEFIPKRGEADPGFLDQCVIDHESQQ